MRYIWRLQQSQMIVGVVYWSLTLAGIFYPYFAPIFDSFGLVKSSQVALGLLILIIIVMLIILLIGYFYDKVFKMWAEQRIIATERNIYAYTRQTAKEIVFYQYYHIPLLLALGCKDEAHFFNKWNERCVDEDNVLRDDVYRIFRWANSYKLRPKDERWLRSVKDEFAKMYNKAPK